MLKTPRPSEAAASGSSLKQWRKAYEKRCGSINGPGQLLYAAGCYLKEETMTVEGKIIIRSEHDLTPEDILAIEQFLNNAVASLTYEVATVAVRVHLNAE